MCQSLHSWTNREEGHILLHPPKFFIENFGGQAILIPQKYFELKIYIYSYTAVLVFLSLYLNGSHDYAIASLDCCLLPIALLLDKQGA